MCLLAGGGKCSPGMGGGLLHHPTPDPQPCSLDMLQLEWLCCDAASTSQHCSDHQWSLPQWGCKGCVASPRVSLPRAAVRHSCAGQKEAGWVQRCHFHKNTSAIPICLSAPGQQPRARQCVYSQVPLIAGGDRTAAWPPWPAAPAKRQQLGTSVRATCSPMCSLACWGHPGVPLAAGRAPGIQVSCGKSQGVLCTSRGAPGHP